MMFYRETIEFFDDLHFDNSREFFSANRERYDRFVRLPLEEMHSALTGTVSRIGGEFNTKRQKCVSGPYADARYNKTSPIKEYMYLRFKPETERKNEVPGLFFDASTIGYRYGFNLYNPTSAGIEKIRKQLLSDQKKAEKALSFDFTLYGEEYKTDRHPLVKQPLNSVLNRKSLLLCADHDIDELFFDKRLCAEIEKTFIDFSDFYGIVRSALERGEV